MLLLTKSSNQSCCYSCYECLTSNLKLAYLSVALNYQTASKEMQLNQGLFQMNKCCGYVLKPQFLRDGRRSFIPIFRFLVHLIFFINQSLLLLLILRYSNSNNFYYQFRELQISKFNTYTNFSNYFKLNS